MTYPSPGTVRISNPSPSYACSGWTAEVGTPDHHSPTLLVAEDSRGSYPAFVSQYQFFARVPLAPGETRDLTLRPHGQGDPPITFALDEWIGDEPLRVVPKLFAIINGVRRQSMPIEVITRSEWLPVMMRSEFIARWAEAPLVAHGQMDFFTDDPTVEWEIEVSYGTTKPGDPWIGDIEGVSVVWGEYHVVDDRGPKGLHSSVWNNGISAYEIEIANRNVEWMHARSICVRGALLCMPPLDRIAEAAASPKAQAMQYRREARPRALLGGWDGRFGPFGIIPRLGTMDATLERQTFYSIVSRRLHTAGNEDDPRAFAQPPYSATTGRQPDFGAISPGILYALSAGDPKALHYLRHDAEGDLRRPVHNREYSTSRVVEAKDHPGTQTWANGPHPQLSSDMLGWPNQTPWINGYTLPDDEHRCGLLLLDYYRLTRSATLGRHIQGMLENDLMAYWRKRQAQTGQGLGSPRMWGRPILTWCKAYDCGFAAAETLVREAVDWVWTSCAWHQHDANADIQVSGEQIEKYGWTRGDSTMIRGWWPWMEAILVVGMRAADLLFDLPKAREVVLRSARTIARHGFYQHQGRWLCAYAVRSTQDGAALPSASYWPAEGQNLDVFTYDAMSEWTLPALDILLSLEPSGPDSERCQSILDHYGKPTSYLLAAQRAVR